MKNIRFARLLFGVLMVGLMVSCMGMEESDPSYMGAPEINTFNVKDNGSLVFELSATVVNWWYTGDVAGRVAECGFYYGNDKNMKGAEKIECKMLGESFSTDITLREYGQTFYVCSYISNGTESNEICSQVKAVSVKELEEYVEFCKPAVVSYDKATKVASVSTYYKVKNGVKVTARGLCYGSSKDLSVNGNNLKDLDLSSTSVIYEIPDVDAGKTYFVRPYLYDGDVIAYGDVQELCAYAVPVVEIGEVSQITSYAASISCAVVDDCGKAIKSRGVVYVKGDEEPTLDTGRSVASGSTGEYTVSLSGLSPNTLYTVRAYAENEKGVAYSAEKLNFTTSVALPKATVSIGSKTSSSAILTGKITSDGGETPSEVGFYYSQSEEVDPSSSIKVTGTLSGSSFSAELNGLSRATRYYVRAYAVNSAGEAVSSLKNFTTLAELPVVETLEVTDVTVLSAVCGGKVTDDGGAEITAKGVVWSTSPNPTITLSTKTVDGNGVGEFSTSMIGLAYSTKYYVCAYATNSAGTTYGSVMEFVTDIVNISNIPDLSSEGTANCYIVSASGINRFPAVKGNSNTSVGRVASVEVLWESFGTSTAPNVGDLIKSTFYSDGYVLFETASSFREGNAVIAAKDASGTILWSWHIWLTDEPEKCVYANNAGTMMDRNLGATSATPGDVGALGLLYQWGRKDPFLGSSSISSSVEAKSTITWPSAVSSSSSRGTIAYAITHPTTFITGNYNNDDWYYSVDSSTDNTRWQSTKTIYDPCPAGWRVPDGGDNSVWKKAGFPLGNYAYNYEYSDEGMLFGSSISSPVTWYPAAGFCNGNLRELFNTGHDGNYWSVTHCKIIDFNDLPEGKVVVYAEIFTFDRGGFVGYGDGDDDDDSCGAPLYNALSVRCIQE